MKLTGKRLILLLLYTPEEGKGHNQPISGRTRLMKMGFLFDREVLSDLKKGGPVEEDDLPEYFAWKYGPFSVSLLNDLEFLINRQFVSSSLGVGSPLPEERAEYEYWVEDMDAMGVAVYETELFQLSEPRGVEMASARWEELTLAQRELLMKFKTALNRAPLSRILEYVYRNYEKEGLTRKSLIRERFLD